MVQQFFRLFIDRLATKNLPCVGSYVDFPCERIERVLVGDDHQCHHLLVGDGRGTGLLPKCSGLEDVDDLFGIDGKALGEFLDQCLIHGFLLLGGHHEPQEGLMASPGSGWWVKWLAWVR